MIQICAKTNVMGLLTEHWFGTRLYRFLSIGVSTKYVTFTRTNPDYMSSSYSSLKSISRSLKTCVFGMDLPTRFRAGRGCSSRTIHKRPAGHLPTWQMPNNDQDDTHDDDMDCTYKTCIRACVCNWVRFKATLTFWQVLRRVHTSCLTLESSPEPKYYNNMIVYVSVLGRKIITIVPKNEKNINDHSCRPHDPGCGLCNQIFSCHSLTFC